MTVLTTDDRAALEKAVVGARDAAEDAARAALLALAVDRPAPFATLDEEQRRLRNALRARARQLGDGDQDAGLRSARRRDRLRAVAPHALRPLPGRERPADAPGGVRRHAGGVRRAGARGGRSRRLGCWPPATPRRMLPGIFRRDDPAVQVRFAPEGRNALERMLADLPPASSRPTTPWAGSTSSGRARRRTRSTPASARSAAATYRR